MSLFANIGAFLTTYHEAISAASALVVAVFTVALFASTRAQLRHLRKQFNATYRPEVVVHAVAPHFAVVDGHELIGASVWCFNKGRTPARHIEIHATITRTTELTTGHLWEKIDSRADNIGRGGKHQFYIPPRYDRRAEASRQSGNKQAGEAKLFCVGTIAYTDETGTRFETGFCRVFDASNGIWKTTDAPEHEYDY